MLATPHSPCSITRPAEVRAAFGGTVSAGVVDNSLPLQPMCRFAVKGSKLGVSGAAVVSFSIGEDAQQFKVGVKEIKGASTVKGVGDFAFYNPYTNAVELLKGTTVAEVQGVFVGAKTARLKADVIALAKAVVKHL